jgi:hypothetical protein
MSKTGLVIPDSHSHPAHDNVRYDYLGKLQVDLRPDFVVSGGDWWDLESLLFLKKFTGGFDAKAYRKDLDVGLEAQERRNHWIKKAKKKRPDEFFIMGNHEERIERTEELWWQEHKDDFTLEGRKKFAPLSYDDLELERFKWEPIPFLEPKVIEGVAFCHYFQSGNMGSAISGDNHAMSLLNKKHMSCVAFHSHRLDYAVAARADGTKIMGLVAGCYLDYKMLYARQSNDVWWSGVTILRNVENGFADVQFVSLATLEKEYGK